MTCDEVTWEVLVGVEFYMTLKIPTDFSIGKTETREVVTVV